MDNRLYSINPGHVTYFESKENYVHIHFNSQKPLIVRSTLTDALNKMPINLFIQVHRSYAVSIFAMERIEKYTLLVGKKSIPIGRSFYNFVLSKITIVGD